MVCLKLALLEVWKMIKSTFGRDYYHSDHI